MPGKSGGLLYEDFLKQLPEDLYGLKMPGVHFSEDAKTAAGVAEPPEEAVAGANDGPPGVSKSTGGTELYAPAKVNPLISGGSRGIQAIQDLLNGFRGNYSPGWYGVKQGRSPQHFDSPVLAGSKELAQLPLTQETEKVGHQNKVRDLLNQATMFNLGTGRQNAQTSLDLAKAESAGKEAGLGRQNKLDIAKLLAQARVSLKYAGPPGKGERDQVALLREAADQMGVVKEMINKYGTTATAYGRLGPLARGANSVGASGLVNLTPQEQEVLDDIQRYEGAIKGLTGSVAIGTEPRRVAYELQKQMNAKLPAAGASGNVARKQLEIVANHIARNYRLQYASKPDFYESQGFPTPDEFDQQALSGLSEPGTSGGGLSPEKRARLDELRRKRGQP